MTDEVQYQARTFAARYDGVCLAPECREPINAGDEVKWNDDQLVIHAGCLDVTEDKLELKGETCPKCFTERARNGACACDA